MKKRYLMTFAALLCVALVGCGTAENGSGLENLGEPIAQQTGSTGQQEADGQDSGSETRKPAEDKGNGEQTKGFAFADLSKKMFEFSSGAGAWQTDLRVERDGYFYGQFNDADMGDAGENYENGTVYTCIFTGRFTEPVKVNDYTWSFKIKDIHYPEAGQEDFADDMRYITAEPYGLEGAGEIYVYLPGTPVSELSEEVKMWLHMYEEPEKLEGYAIVNVNQEEAFESYDRMDPFEEAKMLLQAYQDSSDYISESIQNNEHMTQTEMNEAAKRMYENSDSLLNRLWTLVKYNVAEDRYQEILTEQRAWIAEKEEKVAAAGKEYEGGSMQPLVEYTTAEEMTMARCKVLVEYLK